MNHRALLLDYCDKYDGSAVNGAARGSAEYGDKFLGIRYCEALYNLAESAKATKILECGFGWGFSSMAFIASLSNRGGRIVSIDPHPQHDTTYVHDTAKRLGVDYQFVHMKSRYFQPESTYDLVYIDGDPFQALADYTKFKPHVRPGGLIVMDGYPDQEQPTVAVNAIGGFDPRWYSETNAHAVFNV